MKILNSFIKGIKIACEKCNIYLTSRKVVNVNYYLNMYMIDILLQTINIFISNVAAKLYFMFIIYKDYIIKKIYVYYYILSIFKNTYSVASTEIFIIVVIWWSIWKISPHGAPIWWLQHHSVSHYIGNTNGTKNCQKC